jgi:tRNA dimethylallyltransferase
LIKKENKLIVILGPTAVGKTRLAALLASKINGEIISADSRQVYRKMDIGTGKDLSDYIVGDSCVPYHMIDILDAGEEFNLFCFQKKFFECFKDITGRGKLPLLAGGTGMYLSSVIQNYELKEVDFKKRSEELTALGHEELQTMLIKLRPELHNSTDLNDKARTISAVVIAENDRIKGSIEKPDIKSLIIGVKTDMPIIRERIAARLKKRLKEGMIEEVENLHKNGVTFEKLDFFGLEYRFLGQYLQGILSFNDMYQKLNSAIGQFAKRQMTWFRKMEKQGVVINWIEPGDIQAAQELSREFLE